MDGNAALEPGEVHVYRTRLDFSPAAVRGRRETLSPEERQQLERRPEDERVLERLGLRAILRLLLSRYLEVAPAELPLVRTGDGRPELEGPARVCFDHAHSGPLGVYAFSRSSPVGVDVERLRRLDDLEGDGDPFSADSFSIVERETLRGLPRGLRAEGFFQCWTRKQALLRAAGGTLPCALSDLDVSVTPGVPPRIYRWRETDGRPDDWTLLHLRPGPRHVGAVAVPDRVSGLRLWSWPPEGDGAGGRRGRVGDDRRAG